MLAAFGFASGAGCRTYHRWDFRIRGEKPSLLWEDVRGESPVRVAEVLLSWWPDAHRSIHVSADPAGWIVLDETSLSSLILLGLREDAVPLDFYVLDGGSSWAACAFPVERQVSVLKSLRKAEPDRYHALVSQAGPPGKAWAALLAEIAREISPKDRVSVRDYVPVDRRPDRKPVDPLDRFFRR